MWYTKWFNGQGFWFILVEMARCIRNFPNQGVL